ncbi:hypothetical protein PATSB16_13650 [Pandoraea thiooxydans]|nr:hypothetical protein PATSB16_13650 [Pandoraea thiooxydans]
MIAAVRGRAEDSLAGALCRQGTRLVPPTRLSLIPGTSVRPVSGSSLIGP